MQNYITCIDEFGNAINSEVVRSLLNNLHRFNLEPSEISSTVKALADNGDSDKLKKFASDFYDTWFASNTELINAIGLPRCIDYFVSFREYLYVTWPNDALDFIENNGMNVTIQIFRGTSKSLTKNGVNDLSWTTQRLIAENYAARFPDGVVLTAQVAMRDVLIYIEEEKEIIVHPSKLQMMVGNPIAF